MRTLLTLLAVAGFLSGSATAGEKHWEKATILSHRLQRQVGPHGGSPVTLDVLIIDLGDQTYTLGRVSGWSGNHTKLADLPTRYVQAYRTWGAVPLTRASKDQNLLAPMVLGLPGLLFAGRSYSIKVLDNQGKQVAYEVMAIEEAEKVKSPDPDGKPDEKVVGAAWEQILAFQKVAAAFDLNAPADRIMTELVNAAAALATFTESAESQPLPKFTAALRSTGQEFGAALNAKPADKTSFSDAAMNKFAEAKKCLDNYQKYVQEIEPQSNKSAISATTSDPPAIAPRSTATPLQAQTTLPPTPTATPPQTQETKPGYQCTEYTVDRLGLKNCAKWLTK